MTPDEDPPLCIDEGCPHFGTPHVCIATTAQGDEEKQSLLSLGESKGVLLQRAVTVLDMEDLVASVGKFLKANSPDYEDRKQWLFKWLAENKIDRVREVPTLSKMKMLVAHIGGYNAPTQSGGSK